MNLTEWRSLVSAYPDLQELAGKKVWLPPNDQYDSRALATDGAGNIFLGSDMPDSPSKIAAGHITKIGSATMLTTLKWNGEYNEKSPMMLSYFQGKLYAAMSMTPAKVMKFNPDTMQPEKVWTGIDGELGSRSILAAWGSLWVGDVRTPGRVTKFDANLNKLAVWEAPSGMPFVIFLACDHRWLYVGMFGGIIYKVNPITLIVEGTYNSNDGLRALLVDGQGWLYAGFDQAPAIVRKLHPGTMQQISQWIPPLGYKYSKYLAHDGEHLYSTIQNSTPGQVAMIDTKTMTTISIWTAPPGFNYARGLLFDGLYLYITFETGQVVRKIMRDYDEAE